MTKRYFAFVITLEYLLEGRVTDPDVTSIWFADDGVIWVDVLEGNGFRMSPTKTECMFFPFADPLAPSPEICLNGAVLPKCERFKYLGSLINTEANCDDDVNHQ